MSPRQLLNFLTGAAGFITQPLLNSYGNGTASGTGVVATTERGDGVIHQTVLTLTNVAVSTTDTPATSGDGSLKVYDFPAGNIHVLGATCNLAIVAATGIGATAAVVGSIGTVAAAADATLTSTEANIIPSTAATLTGSAGTMAGKSTGAVTLDGTTTAIDALLNFAIPDAGSTANSTITVNGTITLTWVNLGDN